MAQSVARDATLSPSFPSSSLLMDLCTRFVLNCPAEELTSFDRILFLVEQAHWFYEDFCRTSSEGGQLLRTFTLREFAALMLAAHPSLRAYKDKLNDIFKRFTEYKARTKDSFAVIFIWCHSTTCPFMGPSC